MKKKWIFLIIFLLTSCSSQPVGVQNTIILGTSKGTYAVDPDGNGVVSITIPDGLEDTPDWSADGNWIAYSNQNHILDADQSQVFIMRSNGTQMAQITSEDGDGFMPVWSPDGTMIAYQDAMNIYLVDVRCIQTEDNCEFTPVLLVEGSFPDWSPDGKSITYTVRVFYPDLAIVKSDIYIMDINNVNIYRDITPENEDRCQRSKLSPDGSKIVVGCSGNIYVMDSTGENVKKIGEGGWVDWSPDGTKITYVSSEGEGLGQALNFEGSVTSNALFVMDMDGSNVRRLSMRNDESIHWYKWVP